MSNTFHNVTDGGINEDSEIPARDKAMVIYCERFYGCILCSTQQSEEIDVYRCDGVILLYVL